MVFSIKVTGTRHLVAGFKPVATFAYM